MLVTFFAIAIGSLIGRLRGGRWSGVQQTHLRSTPLLVIAISAILVQAILNPIFPVVWSLIGAVSLIAFGFRNRHLTGVSLVLIGMFLNLAPLLANWATPVSELALSSVGDLNPFGEPDITGARESSTTATRLTFLGDAIPVPIFGTVLSIGDLIALTGVADIFTNLFLIARRRELSLDEAGVSFNGPAHAERVSILSPIETGARSSTDSQRMRYRRKKEAPRSHVPAHAAGEFDPATSPKAPSNSPAHAAHAAPEPVKQDAPAHGEPSEPIVFDLRDEKSEDKNAQKATAAPAHAAPGQPVSEGAASGDDSADAKPAHAAPAIVAAGAHAVQVQPTTETGQVSEQVPELIDLTDPDDPRPIIDLTTSPSDEQMTEFLRRRKAADQEHGRVAVRPPGQRRGRAPVRLRMDNSAETVETSR